MPFSATLVTRALGSSALGPFDPSAARPLPQTPKFEIRKSYHVAHNHRHAHTHTHIHSYTIDLISRRMVSHQIVSLMSYPTLPYPTLPFPTLPCSILPYHHTSHHITSYIIITSCRITARTTPYRIISHHLGGTTCRVKDHHDLPMYSPPLNKTCVRQVMLDKWFPPRITSHVLLHVGRSQRASLAHRGGPLARPTGQISVV